MTLALYKLLATLLDDIDLETTIEDLAWEGVPYDPFIAMCDELGRGTPEVTAASLGGPEAEAQR